MKVASFNESYHSLLLSSVVIKIGFLKTMKFQGLLREDAEGTSS